VTTPCSKVDEYFPDSGDLCYDVHHYDLHLDYKVESNQLKGRAVLDAVAKTDVDELQVDLRGLRVSKVALEPAGVRRYTVKKAKLVVRTARPLEPGEKFRLVVTYAGRPRPISDGVDEMGWEELKDGVIVAGQTTGAPSWFPCNDRPANKASYEMSLTVPSGYHVLANGVLTSTRRGASATTWRYMESEPMATYLATVQIGRYVSRPVQTLPVPMTAVLPERLLGRYDEAFARQPEMLAFFTRAFGAYPFASYSVVITDDELEIPLEAQGLSIFGSNFLRSNWDCIRLVAHELAHQWFGNSLTLSTWRDIWLHEGFACYGEWLWSEESGGPAADAHAREHWAKLRAKDQDIVLANPGREGMFDDRIYKRGALLLHVLRLTLGDDCFFDLLRAWTERHRFGSVSTQMFMELTADFADAPVEDLFTAWLSQTNLPDLPTAP
jgi:aminopeptidase N